MEVPADEGSEPASRRDRAGLAQGFVIVLHGPDHHVAFVNDAHRRLFDSAGWLGRPLHAVFSTREPDFVQRLDDVYRNGATHRADGTAVRCRQLADGTWDTRPLAYTCEPIVDPSGAITGVCCEGVDVTEQRRKDADLRASEEQLRLAVEAADVGLWDVDMVLNTLYWPPRVKAMFGISPGVPVSMADFYEGLHPEDREATSAAFATALDPAQRAVYDVEYRTVGKEDGAVRWVAAKGRGLFDADGRCVRVIGTAIDISRRKAIDLRLKTSEANLREEDRRKDEFLATLSHELRNPLAAVRNAAHLLQHPALDRAAVARWAQVAERQAKTMALLLDDLLEVTRIRVGQVALNKQPVTVGSIVDAALEAAGANLEAKRHRLRVEAADRDAPVHVDALRIAQVLTNLLHNAAKYTDPEGDIVLRSTVDARSVRFEVVDSGVGLAPDEAASLFQMFAQGSAGKARAEGGLGIGLAVAKALVELHGGSLQAFSPGPGRGSTFSVQLPIGDEGAPPPAAPASPPQAGGAVLPGRRVLVVDDNTDSADSMGTLLRMHGFEVSVAYSGPQALAIAALGAPSVCFIDIGMPGMSGYELAPRLREAIGAPGVRLVATTGWGTAEDEARTKAAGFDAHLTKPVDLAQVLALLENAATTGRSG